MNDAWLSNPVEFENKFSDNPKEEIMNDISKIRTIKFNNKIYSINDVDWPLPIIYLIDQLQKNFAPIVLICGKQRIGKSWYMLSLINMIHYYFHHEEIKPEEIGKYVYFSAGQFINQAINVSKSIIVVDEASRDFSKSEWFSITNRVMSKVIETQGDLNNIYIIVLPHACRLAKDHRIYIDLKFVMTRRGEALAIYKKKFHGQENPQKAAWEIRWKTWKLPEPPHKLAEKYKELATANKRQLGQEQNTKMDEIKNDWICGFCGKNNYGTHDFCINCGGKR